MQYLPGFSVAVTGAEFSMFTFIGLECSTADRAGEFDLRTALNYSRMLCPPQLSAFVAAEFFLFAVRRLRNFGLTLQAKANVSSWLVERQNAVSLTVGFYCICGNTKLFCDRRNRHTTFTQFGYDLFLLFRHLDHILVNKKERAEKRFCP